MIKLLNDAFKSNLSVRLVYSPNFHSFLFEDVEYYNENLMVFEKFKEVLYGPIHCKSLAFKRKYPQIKK